MNIRDFDVCYRTLMDAWPLNYAIVMDKQRIPNNTLSAFFYSRIGERVSKDDFLSAIEVVLGNGGPHDPSNIIAAINDVVNARARKKAETAKKEPCKLCLDTGMVCTKDADDYEFVFRCPNSCKPISEKIPVWDNQPGYRLSVVVK